MSVLRNRALLVIAAAESVSLLGSWVAMQAIYSLLIFQKGGGVAQSAGIYLAGLGPALLLSPVAGWLCDKFDRRRLMIASEVLSGLITCGMIFATRIEWLYLLLVLSSISNVVMSPARSTVVPDLVGPDELTRANAFLVQVNGIMRISGPLLAAMLVAFISPQTAFVVDALSFLLSAAFLTRLPHLPPRPERKPEPTGEPKQSVLQTLTASLRQVPLVALVLPFFFVLGWILVSYDITGAVVARDLMQGTIAMKGMIASVVGVGIGLASLALMLSRRPRNAGRDYLVAQFLVICLPASVALADLAGSPLLARAFVFAGCLLGGLGMGIANVQGQTLLQRMAPDGWLGRITGALQSVTSAGQAIGMIATPLLVPDMLSFSLYFGIGSALLGLVSVRTALAFPRPGAARPYAANEVASGD